MFPMEPSQGYDEAPDASELTPPESIIKVKDLPDGSSIFEIAKKIEEEKEEQHKKDFYGNLAEDLEDARLSGLAIQLLEEINEDKKSRQDWEKTINLGLK